MNRAGQLDYLSTITNFIDYEIHKADTDHRTLSSYDLACLLFEARLLSESCDCCTQDLFTTWMGHGSTCQNCRHDSTNHGRSL